MMNKYFINSWENVNTKNDCTLLLGNGASIAINKCFDYATLYGIANGRGLLPNTSAIFKQLATTNFERVLLACWDAGQVSMALRKTCTDFYLAYVEVRNALVEIANNVHPVYADLLKDLEQIGTFANKFHTVFSLNYDLTLYWASAMFNAKNNCWFNDDLEHATPHLECTAPLDPAKATSVYYPHGNMSQMRDYAKIELPFSDDHDLNQQLKKWTLETCVPVFVSEGSSKEKLAAIYRSHYLTSVYEKLLPAPRENLVVYGWSFGRQDQHILNKILKYPLKHLSVSVFTGQSDSEQQTYCQNVLKAVGDGIAIEFFDSQSPGCWNNPDLPKED